MSNAIPWAWTTERETDLNGVLAQRKVVEAAAEFLDQLFGNQPLLTELVACGDKAKGVVEELRKAKGWSKKCRFWRQGSVRSVWHDRSKYRDSLPEHSREVFEARGDLLGGFHRGSAEIYVKHALAHGPV